MIKPDSCLLTMIISVFTFNLVIKNYFSKFYSILLKNKITSHFPYRVLFCKVFRFITKYCKGGDNFRKYCSLILSTSENLYSIC